jgi:hypothetical protein
MYLFSRLAKSDQDLCSADQAIDRCVDDVKLPIGSTPLFASDHESLSTNRSAGEK